MHNPCSANATLRHFACSKGLLKITNMCRKERKHIKNIPYRLVSIGKITHFHFTTKNKTKVIDYKMNQAMDYNSHDGTRSQLPWSFVSERVCVGGIMANDGPAGSESQLDLNTWTHGELQAKLAEFAAPNIGENEPFL